MITEMLGLAGSGALGAAVGIFSDFMQRRSEIKLKEAELRYAQECRLNNQTYDYLNNNSFVTSPVYGIAFLSLTVTYCLCAIICFVYPGVELATFHPGAEPGSFSFLFGLFKLQLNNTQVYIITTGGVGYALLHPLAFQIGTVITGINPARKA